MKRLFILLACLTMVFVLSSQAQASLIYLSPTGTVGSLNVGDTVSITAYYTVEGADDTLYGWTEGLVYDSTELTYTGYTLGNNITGTMGTNYNVETGLVEGNPYRSVGRYDWSFQGVTINGGTTYELFTMYFTFNGGTADGIDVWLATINNAYGVDVGMDLESGYTDTSRYHVAGGPDYSSVPIPGAVWLLGSGMFSLVGLRRRFTHKKDLT